MSFRGRSVSYYCPIKYKKTGNGSKCKYFSPKNYETEEELIKDVEEFKTKIKERNKEVKKTGNLVEYKEKIKNDINLILDKKTGNSTAIIASSKAGKTVIMSRIYKKYYSSRKYITTLFSMNPHIFTRKDLKKIMGNQKRLIKHRGFGNEEKKVIGAQKLLNEKTENHYNFCDMFDDLIQLNRSNIINDLILTYRNSNISTIILMQYSKLLSKMTRSNFNNMIFGYLNNDEAIEDIVKIFLSSIFKEKFKVEKIKDQISLYKELVKDYKFIYYRPVDNHLEVFRLNLK